MEDFLSSQVSIFNSQFFFYKIFSLHAIFFFMFICKSLNFTCKFQVFSYWETFSPLRLIFHHRYESRFFLTLIFLFISLQYFLIHMCIHNLHIIYKIEQLRNFRILQLVSVSNIDIENDESLCFEQKKGQSRLGLSKELELSYLQTYISSPTLDWCIAL